MLLSAGFAKPAEECSHVAEFDYLVVNEDFERALRSCCRYSGPSASVSPARASAMVSCLPRSPVRISNGHGRQKELQYTVTDDYSETSGEH